MFKITKGWARNTFKLEAYLFIKETNFYTKLYTVDNKTAEEMVQLLQGRIVNSDVEDLKWALHIAKLPRQYALIGEDGIVKATPITRRRTKNGYKGNIIQTQKYESAITTKKSGLSH